MARPRGASRRRYRDADSSSHFGLWIFTILLFITFTLGLVYLGKHKVAHPKNDSMQNVAIATKQETATEEKSAIKTKPTVRHAKTPELVQPQPVEKPDTENDSKVESKSDAVTAAAELSTTSKNKSNSIKKIKHHQTAQPSEDAVAAGQDAEEKLQQKFDFYDLLSQDTSASNADVSNSKDEANKKQNTGSAKNGYVVEVAKYKNYENVDHVKAELAMLGFEAHVNAINVEGAMVYVISLGPYANKGAAIEVQQQLANSKINAVVRKG